MDKHIVYAVVGRNRRKVRLTAPVRWDAAIRRWYQLDDARRAGLDLRVSKYGTVQYLVVRADNDPAWPAHGQRATVKAAV